MASKPKDRGRRGGGRGVAEDRRRRKEIHRENEGMGKGGQREKSQENAEKGDSQRKSVCTMCLYVFGGDNEKDMGQSDNTTLPFRLSAKSRLDIHPPSPPANTAPFFDICFPF